MRREMKSLVVARTRVVTVQDTLAIRIKVVSAFQTASLCLATRKGVMIYRVKSNNVLGTLLHFHLCKKCDPGLQAEIAGTSKHADA